MKKKYSLAFWWWASRGFAHIWVLKYLEEEKIEIIELSWTSMWAIVASLMAIWKTSDDIINIAKSINFKKLVDLDFSYWLIKWKKIYKKLEEIFKDIKIEDLDIPLKIIATDIETWKEKVFSSWRIVDAIRASISLPWIIVPYKLEDSYYVDWWVVNNLPVNVLDWENIIWVSALKTIEWPLILKKKFLCFEFKAWFFDYNYQVLHRSILLMMRQNEEKAIKNTRKKWIIIRPDFWDLDYQHFNKIEEFINIWYEEAKKELKKDV